jgi:OmpA-OmpF porin, OOP family
MNSRIASLLAFLIIVLAIAEAADAQSLRERARRAAERGAERAVEREAERRADRAVTGAIECVFGDRACSERAEAEGREVTYVDEAGQAVEPGAQPAADAPPATPPGNVADPNDQVWVNYDFVPGDRVIFFEDFAAERVGDFPRRLEFGRGNMETAQWQGQNWLRATTNAVFAISLPEALPDRFTFEMDVVPTDIAWVYFGGEARGQAIQIFSSSAGLQGLAMGNVAPADRGARDRAVTLRVMADGGHAKVYVNETRVANVPNVDLGRSDKIFVRLQASERRAMLLNNIRVAAGGRALYDALTADGRVVSRGILFDTGSDRIRPESSRTLKEIGEMLQQHGDLRLRIEGHTDSVGSAEANQQLSERRANSVRQYLVQHYNVAGDRLEAAGLGEAQPLDSNDTAEGRQNNRRVELVRL